MLAQIYVEALLVDAGLADRVWSCWSTGEFDDAFAALLWKLIARMGDESVDYLDKDYLSF
jgi:hypothetical protein